MADLAATINAQQEVSRIRDIDSLDLNAQLKAWEIERYKSDTTDRKWLAEWVVTVVTFWLIAVIVILANKDKMNLSDTVLVALLSTTSINIIGLSAIVLRGHFKVERGTSDSF